VRKASLQNIVNRVMLAVGGLGFASLAVILVIAAFRTVGGLSPLVPILIIVVLLAAALLPTVVGQARLRRLLRERLHPQSGRNTYEVLVRNRWWIWSRWLDGHLVLDRGRVALELRGREIRSIAYAKVEGISPQTSNVSGDPLYGLRIVASNERADVFFFGRGRPATADEVEAVRVELQRLVSES